VNLFVCVKQVPATNAVQVDPQTGVLLRGGVESKMNPYDLFALEAALRLREARGGRITVGTMGPPQAEAVLREAVMMGADRAFLFTDRRFAGADVLATSYTLAQAIRSIGDFDAILCGKQTTDGDTAQVGPAIAEHMGIPHAAWVSAVEADGEGLTVEQQLGERVERCYLPFPCLITVEQDIYTPRLPSLRRAKEIGGDWPVERRDLSGFLDQDAEHYGLCGSPTRVERIFAPEHDTKRELLRGGGLGRALYERLKARKLI